jgi:hypothetical protein
VGVGVGMGGGLDSRCAPLSLAKIVRVFLSSLSSWCNT